MSRTDNGFGNGGSQLGEGREGQETRQDEVKAILHVRRSVYTLKPLLRNG